MGVGLLIIGLAVIGSFSSASSPKMLKVDSTESILAISDTSIYILNDKKIIQLPASGEGQDFSVIDSGVSFASSSPSKNKIYYQKGLDRNSKAFIFDISSNNTKEYQPPDEFFWKKDAGQFVSYQSNKSSILSESLAVEFSNLPYSGFISYAEIVLGSPNDESLDADESGYRWAIINKDSASFKSLDIQDYKEETATWVNGDYLLYINNNDQTVIINNKNQRKPLNQLVAQSKMTTTAGDKQYFVSSSKPGYIDINSLNLSDGQVKLQKKVDVSALLKSDGLSLENIKQVYSANNSLYILIGSKIMRIPL